MKVLISGSSGLIGSALVDHLSTSGHSVAHLKRSGPSIPGSVVVWHPEEGKLAPADLEGFDAIIHLSGENLMGLWTDSKKKKILESRVKSTQLLAETIKKLKNPPKVLINASAVGYYGNRGPEKLTESSPPGQGFLATVCKEWEEAAQKAKAAGVRVVMMRTGIVLSPKGGALKAMLTPFKLYLGGVVGTGEQYWPWVTLDDLVRMFEFAMTHEGVEGPVNGVSGAVTNKKFTAVLGKVLNRPTVFSVPAWAAKTLMGEMAEEMLLTSTRALPAKLDAFGFKFMDKDLDFALVNMLKS